MAYYLDVSTRAYQKPKQVSRQSSYKRLGMKSLSVCADLGL